jgi:AcrR family transcriptional regulator
MPYPAQIDAEKVIEQARAMIEAEGVEGVSLHKLAAALGVKAPSLYRYFAGRDELLQAVNLGTAQALGQALLVAVQEAGENPQARALAMAHACRAFAHANPRTYALAYTTMEAAQQPDASALEAIAIPLQAVIADVAGESNSLTALRGLWALAHGFALMELNGQFRRGGDLGAAFDQAVRAYLAGWENL